MAAPVGVVNSPSIVDFSSGMPRSNSAVAGAGMLHSPCAILIRPTPVGTGEAHNAIDPQQIPADGGADDVGDRVGGADLMEMDLIDRRAMHAGLGAGQGVEDSPGGVPLPHVQLAGVDHRQDVAAGNAFRVPAPIRR